MVLVIANELSSNWIMQNVSIAWEITYKYILVKKNTMYFWFGGKNDLKWKDKEKKLF